MNDEFNINFNNLIMEGCENISSKIIKITDGPEIVSDWIYRKLLVKVQDKIYDKHLESIKKPFVSETVI